MKCKTKNTDAMSHTIFTRKTFSKMKAKHELDTWKRLCYFQSLFGLETFVAPVLVIFYIGYAGFSFSQYAMLMAYIFFLSWFFQIPTGAIADRYGKKACLLIGNVIYIFGMVSLVAFKVKTPILVTAFLFSFGSALSTGAFQAMMYSAYAAHGRESEFNSVNARGNSLALLGGAIGAASGGVLASYSLALPMVTDIVILFFTTIVMTFTLRNTDNSPQNKPASLQTIAIVAISAAFRSKKLFFSILVAAAAFAGVRTGFNLYQPLLAASGVSLDELGIIFAGFSLFSATVAYAYSKVRHDVSVGSFALLLICTVFIASAIVADKFPSTAGIIAAIACHQIVRAIYPSLSAYMINVNITAGSSASRTTILSLAALVRSLTAALFSYGMALASGHFRDTIIFSAVSLTSAGFILAFGLRSINESREKNSTPSPTGN
jgi:MFS family permease